jgi:hypothetical protein
VTNEKAADTPLTLAMVRDIAAKLKAADDAQRFGSGWLRVTAEGAEYVPAEEVMTWPPDD